MERNAGDFAPKGEIPTEAEFARLLCDKTFVDYFNVFLSLPVFPQRLMYRFASQTLELDPPLQRTQYRLDRMKLMRWVRTNRAPYFFKSDLYLEYILCKLLQKSQLHFAFMYEPEKSSAKDKIIERQLISRWLGRISGMRRFRLFMSRTAGHRALQFWMDVERLKRCREMKDEDWSSQLRDVEAKYLVKGTITELPSVFKDSNIGTYQFSDGERVLEQCHQSDTETTLVDKILVAQGFFMRQIQNYWMPRFIIHCKLLFNKRSGRSSLKVYRPNFYVVEVQSLSEINLSKDEEQPSGSSNRSLTAKNVTLKRQYVSNLLSMFSSTTARHSEMSALINLEDTGETNIADAENQRHDSHSEHREWLVDEFPLLDISEESLVSSSRNSSAKTRHELSPLPIEYPPMTPSPEADSNKVAISRKEMVQREKSLMKIKQSILCAKSKETSAKVDDSSTSIDISESFHQPSQHAVITEEARSSYEISSTTTNKLVQNVTPSTAEEVLTSRCPSATPYRRSSTGTPNSLTISQSSHSNSSQSIQTPSRRRMSITSASHHASSSSSIGSSSRMANSSTPKKVNKPPRRGRSMSISFRLADFSFMVDDEKDTPKTDEEAKDSKFMLPKLDIEALQEARSKAVERKKIEDRQKMVEILKKKKKLKKGSTQTTDDKNEKRRGKKLKEVHSKKNRSQSKGKSGKIAKLTVGNLERFNVQNLQNPRYLLRRSSMPGSDQVSHLCKSDPLALDNSLPGGQLHTTDNVKSYESSTLQSGSRTSVATKLPSLFSMSARTITFEDIQEARASKVDDSDNANSQQMRGALLSDRLAGKPWETFLKKHGKYEELHHLQFWQISHDLLLFLDAENNDMSTPIIKQLVIQRMTALHLVPSGRRYVDIGEHLLSELLRRLESGLNIQETLLSAQKMTTVTLSASWNTFQKHDKDEFLMRTAYRKTFARSTFPRGGALNASSETVLDKDSQLSLTSQETSNHVLNILKNARGKSERGSDEIDASDRLTIAPHRMWKALSLAEGIVNSALPEEDLSDPSDPEVDSEDEGSLRRPKMAVYKERKVEKLVQTQPSKPKEMAIITSKEKRETTRSLPKADESQSSVYRPKENKGVCTAIRKNGKTIYRPPRPKLFQDVLRDQGHLEFFRRFLIKENSELPLQFWNAVEQMRTSSRDAKSRQNKTILIVRKFFGKSTDFGAALQCDADVIQDIPTMEKVTPQMLLSAQACVARSMEEAWFETYKDTFPEDSIDSDSETSQNDRKLAPREKTKALWAMFINNVISFRRGLMNAASLKAFKDFLGKEVRREVEKQNQTGIQSKRMISNKVVVVEKLLNDLSFWAEVERFKDLADNAARAAAVGTYTLEDEDYVQQKARSIIDCFLHSQVPPKVQINIPQEMADDILECADGGLIERGLFHDAALYIFTVLLYCWKRFCRERFSPPQDSELDMTSSTEKGKKRKKKRTSTTPTVCGVKIKTVTGTSVDEPPKLHFTLQHGLQLVLPPKPRQEDVQRQRLRQLLRQLYPTADESSIEYYLRQHLGGEKSQPVGGDKLPQQAINSRRLSKAFISGTVAAQGSNPGLNLLQMRRATRHFDSNKLLSMQRQESSQNNKDILEV